MKDILDKISSYSIFNYLLPGVIFAVLLEKFTTFSLIQKDAIIGVFTYYFVGLVISRVGSIIIEPLLKEIHFVRFSEYRDFVIASQQDSKLEILSEASNTYRTLCSLFLLLALIMGYENVARLIPSIYDWNAQILTTFLLIIFGISYRKQAQYVLNRVNATLKKG